MKTLKHWRTCRQEFRASPGIKSAIRLQQAQFALRAEVKSKLKIIKGGKHETGLRY